MNVKLTELFVQLPYSFAKQNGNVNRVYMVLRAYSFKYTSEYKDRFVCSIDEIATETEMGRRTVIEALKELRNSGYVELLGYSKDLGRTVVDHPGSNLRSVWRLKDPEKGAEMKPFDNKGCKTETNKGAEMKPIAPEKGAEKDTLHKNDIHKNGDIIIEAGADLPPTHRGAVASVSTEAQLEWLNVYYNGNTNVNSVMRMFCETYNRLPNDVTEFEAHFFG